MDNKNKNIDLEETKVDFDIDSMFKEEESSLQQEETVIDQPWDYRFEEENNKENISRSAKIKNESASLYTKIIFSVIVVLALASLLWLSAKALKILPGSANNSTTTSAAVVQKLTIQSLDSTTTTESSEETTTSTTTVETVATTTASAVNGTTYTVKAGDSLSKIAKAYNTTIAALQQANGSAVDKLLPGQKIIIPSTATTSTDTTTNSTATNSTHTVKAGDTLYSIAKANGLTVAKLKQLNGLKTDTVAIGTVLKLK